MQKKFALLMRSRLISGGVWALSSKVIVAVCSLALNAMLARLLGPEEVGVYFLVLTWVSIAALVAQFGLGHAVIKLLGVAISSQDSGAARGVVRAVTKLGLIGALTMGALTYSEPGRWATQALFAAPLMMSVLGATALIVILTSLQNLFAETIRGFRDVPKASLVGGLSAAVVYTLLVAFCALLQGRSSLSLILWMNVFSLAIGTLLGAYWIARALAALPPEPVKHPVNLIGLTAPMLVINVCSFALMQADLWILGMFRPPAEVALYGAASRLAGTLWMISAVSTAVLAPVIAQTCARGDTSSLERVLRAAATATALAALPLVAAFAVFPAEILSVIYGAYYAAGAPVLAFLAIGIFVNLLLGMRGYVLLMTGRERSLMRIMLSSALLNVLACSLAARYGSLTSVAVAAMGANIVGYCMEAWLVRKTLGIWTFFSVGAISTFQDHISRHLSPDGNAVECGLADKNVG